MARTLAPNQIRSIQPIPFRGPTADGDDFGAQVGRAGQNLGRAVSGLGSKLDGLAKTQAALAERRQKAEDKAFLDRLDITGDMAYQKIAFDEKGKAESGAEGYFDTLRSRYQQETPQIVSRVVEDGGYRPSETAMRDAQTRLMRRQYHHLKKGLTFENNERIRHLKDKLGETVTLIADSAAEHGELETAITRIEESIGSYDEVLTPKDSDEVRENAAKTLFERFRASGDPEAFKERADRLIKEFRERTRRSGEREAGTGAKKRSGAKTSGARYDGVLSVIRKAEAPGDSYNRIFGTSQTFDLTSKTIGEVKQLQAEMLQRGSPSSAVGAYQFLRKTLAETQQSLGIDDDTLFTEEVQDRLAVALLKRRGVDSFLAGEISEEEFMNNLAKEWAGLPTSDGTSYYEGDGLNKAQIGRDLVARAVSSLKSGEPFAETASIEGKFVRLLIENRDKLKRDADRALEGRRFEMKRLLDDDIESIKRTGEGVDGIDLDQFSKVLTDNQINRYKQQRRQAKRVHDATADMWELQDDKIEERIDSLEPSAGEDDFSFKADVYDQAVKIARDVRETRENDPAKSVAEIDIVTQAAGNVDPANPQTVQNLVRTRLEAQERVGIPEPSRRPITRAEAKVIAAPLQNLSDGDYVSALEDLARELQPRYGPLTDEVMTSAVEMMIRSRTAAETMNDIISSFVRKGTIPQADLGRLREELETEAIDRAMNPSTIADQATEAFPSSDLAESARLMEQYLSGQTPPNEAINFLRQHPEMAPQFDQKYGAGQAQQYLEAR
jgi:muramidase (phage lysozyme)